MPYTNQFILTDDQRAHVRSALYDYLYHAKGKLDATMDGPNKYNEVAHVATLYFRASRAIEAMGYTCTLPEFTPEEMSYDGSDDILANIIADMEPQEEFTEPADNDRYCSCGLTVEACEAKTYDYVEEDEKQY